MNLLIFALFLIFQPSDAAAGAFLQPSIDKEACWHFFKQPFPLKKSVYSEWPKITDEKTPLPEGTKKRILSHPKVKELKAFYKEGQGLAFDFAYLGLEFSHKGEYIQRVFLIKIIKLIFPKAKIVTRDYSARFKTLPPFSAASKIHIFLQIMDVRESVKFASEREFEEYLSIHISLVDMVLLKMANSSQKDLSEKYKKSFPAFEKNTALSLYLPEKHLIYNVYKSEREESLYLSHILDEFLSLGFRKVFLTSHFSFAISPEVTDRFLSSLSSRFDRILFLSRLSQKELFQIQDQEKIIFLNDLTGYTPVLHSLADLAFIFGPVNMLEGLFLGAKTLFMSEKDQSAKYRPAFEQLKQTALKTNRAVYIEDLKEAGEALSRLNQLSSEKAVVYPDEVVLNPSKGDALSQLLDRLSFQIAEHDRLSRNKRRKSF